MNEENLSQGKNLIGWILGHHFQGSINQESYHYLGLFQNTNLQLNLYSNPQLDLIL